MYKCKNRTPLSLCEAELSPYNTQNDGSTYLVTDLTLNALNPVKLVLSCIPGPSYVTALQTITLPGDLVSCLCDVVYFCLK
jgi:hypothetical protein